MDVAGHGRRRGRLGYRGFMLLGFVMGGAVFAATLGSFHFSLAYGTAGGVLPAASGAQVPLLLLSGALMGFGARTARGCTGGHGMCGTSLGSPDSFAATATFMATAVLLSHPYHLL